MISLLKVLVPRVGALCFMLGLYQLESIIRKNSRIVREEYLFLFLFLSPVVLPNVDKHDAGDVPWLSWYHYLYESHRHVSLPTSEMLKGRDA